MSISKKDLELMKDELEENAKGLSAEHELLLNGEMTPEIKAKVETYTAQLISDEQTKVQDALKMVKAQISVLDKLIVKASEDALTSEETAQTDDKLD